jgi:hypothetical protein
MAKGRILVGVMMTVTLLVSEIVMVRLVAMMVVVEIVGFVRMDRPVVPVVFVRFSLRHRLVLTLPNAVTERWSV